MECDRCGAENDEDARFCSQCRAPIEEAPAPAAPIQGGGVSGAQVLGIVSAVLAIGVAIMRLASRPSVHIETIPAPPPIQYAEPDAPAVTSVRTEAPERAPTESERTLAGTWVGRVGLDAPRRASMAGTMTQLGALQQGLVQPVDRCLWIELYDNLRGFQHECGVVNGEPSVLAQTDPVTGRQSDLGVALRWRFEEGALRLTYDADLVVGATHLRDLALALPDGSSPFDVTMTFPGHEDLAAQTHTFEAFPGRYLGE